MSTVEIIIWVVTVAVPAGIGIWKAIKAGQLKKALLDFSDAVEIGGHRETKLKVKRAVGKLHDTIIMPYLLEKGYVKDPIEETDTENSKPQ